jgi:hypothetical protein
MRTLTASLASTGVSAPNDDSKNFGIYGGAGVEFFPFTGNHFFIGADVRYHMILFCRRVEHAQRPRPSRRPQWRLHYNRAQSDLQFLVFSD